MQYIYTATNRFNGNVYVGKTKNLKARKAGHKCMAKTGKTRKCKFHNAIRKYGWDAFEWRIALHIPIDADVDWHEQQMIDYYKGIGECYNLLPGGGGGHSVKPENKELWRERMKESRAGRKPALGMKHSDENKELFSKLSKEWWATQVKYEINHPWEISFKDANEKFGISKTHFYRLRKLACKPL